MSQQLTTRAGHRPPRAALLRRTLLALLGALVGLSLVPAAASAQEQVLVWTAGNDVTRYLSAPQTAVAGPARVIFDNSVAAGNTTGMPHTLTFDTDTPGYNHDVDLNITANPFDANGGYYEAEIVLTPGVYRYFCAIPGHGMMWGELVVTDGGGDPDPDTTPPEVTTTVTGDQDEDGSYIGSATVTITATDDDSGIDTVQYTLDDGDWTTYDGPITITQPGHHTLTYRATDHAGNTTEGTITFTVVEEDTGPGEPGECSDTRATVVIGGIDTGVENAEVGDGCTINDLIAEDGEYGTHGAFVRHVGDVVRALTADGVLDQRSAGTILRAAAASDVGR